MSVRTLYVSDMDGTLLNSDALLSTESATLLNRSIAEGALFTVATARTAATVQPLLDEVHFTMPAIVMTGAAWWHFDRRQYSHCRFIRPERAELIRGLFEASTVHPFVYTLPADGGNKLKVFYNNPTPSVADAGFIAQRKHLALKEFIFGRLPDIRLMDRVMLFFASGPKDEVESIAAHIQAVTPCSVSCYDDIYNPGTALIEIFAEGVSKAHAINEMKTQYDIDEVVVFGDNLNDLPMFGVADMAIAVANATESVRTAADRVIGSNDTASVARYIAAEGVKGAGI